MYNIWDQDHRYRQICDPAVSLLDQGQQPELCDPEIHKTA